MKQFFTYIFTTKKVYILDILKLSKKFIHKEYYQYITNIKVKRNIFSKETLITLYTHRTRLVIGSEGSSIRKLESEMQKLFKNEKIILTVKKSKLWGHEQNN